MEWNRKRLMVKLAVAGTAVPILLWAYEYGPDPGHSGVPGESGTCATAGCHTGTANDPANKGSVSVTFPNGKTYVPGVKQHLTVTIADPAASQQAWGFQLTARASSNASAMAGSLAFTDANTLLMCSQVNLANFQAQCQNASSDVCKNTSTTCPLSFSQQYIEHSLTGFNATKGPGSGSYQFDWTPPATNVGNVVIYVAGNAGPPGMLTSSNGHIYTTTYTLTPSAGGNTPTINAGGVVSGASFQPGIVPGSWLTITGSNLSPVTDTWEKAIVNGKLPTVLDGVSVNVGSTAAYVYYISPTQINVQAPDVGTGPVPVTVTTPGGTSAAVTATVVAQSPAFFLWPGNQVVGTRNSDASLAVKAGTFAGATTVAAKPGDVLILWGTGFGPTTPPVAAGIQVPPDKIYNASPVSVKIGTADAPFFGAALSPGFAGLYQVAIQVPSLADGDYALKATVSGATSPDGVILSVKK
jgi:uncharacterized protein (TIGR03437 family)